MNNNILEMLILYNIIFPDLQTDEKTFSDRLLIDKGSKILEHREKDLLVGYSVVNDDGILLLCVDANYRKKGIGTDLLRRSEEQIKKQINKINKINKINLGTSRNTYLLCGVPMTDDYDFHTFFQKHGYSGNWTSFDMIIDLSKYKRIQELENNDDEIIIRHRRKDREDIEKSIKCGEIIGGWGDIYKNANDLIVAESKGEIIGAVIVNPEFCLFPKSLIGAGSFGCLGIIERYREQGIGMKLCQEAICSLKDSGCNICHIGYTWLDWWYGKLGAEKYVNYWMGDKRI